MNLFTPFPEFVLYNRMSKFGQFFCCCCCCWNEQQEELFAEREKKKRVTFMASFSECTPKSTFTPKMPLFMITDKQFKTFLRRVYENIYLLLVEQSCSPFSSVFLCALSLSLCLPPAISSYFSLSLTLSEMKMNRRELFASVRFREWEFRVH